MKTRYCFRIYNLPEIHEDEISASLIDIPNLKHYWIAKDKQNICVGYCWCEFSNIEDMQNALENITNNDTQIGGNKVYIVC